MNYANHRYIASCVFTRDYPELSFRIQGWLKKRFDIDADRCCTVKYKIQKYEDAMQPAFHDRWCALRHTRPWQEGDVMVSICHNCSAMFIEHFPQVTVKSLWELILEDDTFVYPDYKGEVMTLQDCWRSRDSLKEQLAVREILKKMNIQVVELENNFIKADFCGTTLFSPEVPRNIKLAPKRFVEQAEGLFQPHTEEEQDALVKAYCERYTTEKIVTYCHYCLAGILQAGKHGIHLAQMLFPE